jgi:chromosome partitioning protein
VINNKGGSGKSTLAISLAAMHSNRGIKTELIDLDPQSISYQWGFASKQIRSQKFLPTSNVPFSLALRLEADTQLTVIDCPSHVSKFDLEKYTSMADIIVIPTQSTPIEQQTLRDFLPQLAATRAVANKNVKIGCVVTRFQGCQSLDSIENTLAEKNISIIGKMSEQCEYQDMFLHSESSFDEKHDALLWNTMFDWLNVQNDQIERVTPNTTVKLAIA